MPATLTASTVNASPRAVHAGAYPVLLRFDYNGRSVSASDVILLGYLPINTLVTSVQAWGGDGATGTTFKFGITGTDTYFSTAVTLSAAGLNTGIGFVPKSPSLSADAEGYLRVQVTATKAAGTSTVTGSINLLLMCTQLPVGS